MPCCCFENDHFALESTWQPDCDDAIHLVVVVTDDGVLGHVARNRDVAVAVVEAYVAHDELPALVLDPPFPFVRRQQQQLPLLFLPPLQDLPWRLKPWPAWTRHHPFLLCRFRAIRWSRIRRRCCCSRNSSIRCSSTCDLSSCRINLTV